MKKFLMTLSAAIMFAGAATADYYYSAWTSIDDQSSVAFGSVKKDVVGEVHHFNTVKGTVNSQGQVNIAIDLTSVETNIDIRNERMMKHVFGNAAQATLTGSVDMSKIKSMAVGDTKLMYFDGSLSFAGNSTDIEAELLIVRLSNSRVLVTTADFIMLQTEELGINAGIDKLMQLAKLPGITRVTPVSIRMVFEK